MDREIHTCYRREVLSSDAIFMDPETNSKGIIKFGTLVNAEYCFRAKVYPSSGFPKHSSLDYYNAVISMFTFYGEQCADSKFLNEKIKEHFPKLDIEEVIVLQCDKTMSYHYPGRTGGRTVYSEPEDILVKLQQDKQEQGQKF